MGNPFARISSRFLGLALMALCLSAAGCSSLSSTPAPGTPASTPAADSEQPAPWAPSRLVSADDYGIAAFRLDALIAQDETRFTDANSIELTPAP